ncbi:hypothetical protein M0804_003525 [Polistes exclamans]|nr:hypothetical protein M0804_003525 [Polistes exclamans]
MLDAAAAAAGRLYGVTGTKLVDFQRGRINICTAVGREFLKKKRALNYYAEESWTAASVFWGSGPEVVPFIPFPKESFKAEKDVEKERISTIGGS